jgi:hypothetical protein
MKTFLQLLKSSVITTSVVTLALTGVLCYLWCIQVEPPAALLTVWLVLLGVTGGKLPELVQALRK